MNIFYTIPAALFLTACGTATQPLVVKQFQLRDQETNFQDEPMIRMEKQRRLRGAVSMAERKERLGQYYTLVWNDPAGVGQGDVEVIFQYQQGTTGSRIKRMVKSFPASSTQGTAEFAVIGKDYFEGGKVLTWKATLMRGKRIVSSNQSYLWE